MKVLKGVRGGEKPLRFFSTFKACESPEGLKRQAGCYYHSARPLIHGDAAAGLTKEVGRLSLTYIIRPAIGLGKVRGIAGNEPSVAKLAPSPAFPIGSWRFRITMGASYPSSFLKL